MRMAFLAVALSVLGVSRGALGLDEKDEPSGVTCRATPETPRHSSSIWLGREAIEIRRGETLCLVPELASHSRAAYRSVALATADEPSIQIQLLEDTVTGGSGLTIRNVTFNPMRVRVMLGDADNAVLREDGVLRIAPGTERRVDWEGSEDRVVLFDWGIEPSLSGTPPQQPRQIPRRPMLQRLGNIGLAIGIGQRRQNLRDLDEELLLQGYSETNLTFTTFAVDLPFSYRRFRASMGASAGGQDLRHISTGREASLWTAVGGISFGYELWRSQSFSVFPLMGVELGELRLEIPKGTPPILPRSLSTFDVSRRVVKSTGLISFGLGMEQLLLLEAPRRGSLFAPLLCTYLGYRKQFAQSRWRLDSQDSDESYSRSPGVDLSGAYVWVGIGFAIVEFESPPRGL